MRNKIIVIGIMMTLLTFGINFADASILNSHFGITPTIDGTTKQFNNSWVPTFSGTGAYGVANWNTGGINPSPFGDMGEAFDVEAMYLDIDGSAGEIYFAIVTSMPQAGYAGSMFGFSSVPFFLPSDIRIGLGSGSVYQYGIKITGVDAGKVYQGSTWTYTKGSVGFANGYPAAPLSVRNPADGNKMSTTINTSTGTNTGTVSSFAYYDTGLVENPDLNPSGGMHMWSTYVIEGKIPFSTLTGYTSSSIPITMLWSPDCNNDWEYITTPIPESSTVPLPIPEPSTVLLLGFGLTAIGFINLRRKNK